MKYSTLQEVLHLLKFEPRVSQIKCAILYFCFLKSKWGNDSDLVKPKGEFEIVCLFFLAWLDQIFSLQFFFFFFNHLKLKVDYMQEFTFTVFVTKRTQICSE